MGIALCCADKKTAKDKFAVKTPRNNEPIQKYIVNMEV